MTQSDFGTIVASTKTGAALATDLNNWRDALHSGHRGSTAPSYAVQGLIWLDDAAGVTSVLVKRYDGADWITEGVINETANTYMPYFQGAAIGTAALGNTNVLDKTGACTAVAADRGKLIDCSSGTWALTLTAPGTLADGWYCAVRNSGSGVITVTPASGNIDGAATLPLSTGDSCLIFCNGTGFFSVGTIASSFSGGGPGLGNDSIIRTNGDTITEDVTFVLGGEYQQGISAGPSITIASGKTVTIPAGCSWTILGGA